MVWVALGHLGDLLRVILGAAEEQGEFKVETSQSDGVPVPKQPEGDTTSPGSDWADGTVLSIEAGWSLGAGRLECQHPQTGDVDPYPHGLHSSSSCKHPTGRWDQQLVLTDADRKSVV